MILFLDEAVMNLVFRTETEETEKKEKRKEKSQHLQRKPDYRTVAEGFP